MKRFLAGVLLFCLYTGYVTGSEKAVPTLFVVGDSTASNGPDCGWGSQLGKYFDPNKVAVVNGARGGRSSRTFITEGLWDRVLESMKPGDTVLIQFGHNDGGLINDRHRARCTIRGSGDEVEEIDNLLTGKHEVVHTYGWYLRQFIIDARAKGAACIVCSPIPRNLWQDGKVLHSSNDYGRWAAEAARTEGACFIDLNAIIADSYDKMGPEKVTALYFPPGEHTHTRAAGAMHNAACVVKGLKALNAHPLTKYLKR